MLMYGDGLPSAGFLLGSMGPFGSNWSNWLKASTDTHNEKACRGDANTAECALAAVRRSQKFSPCPRPLPGGARWPKFNQLETFTYSFVRIGAHNFELLC